MKFTKKILMSLPVVCSALTIGFSSSCSNDGDMIDLSNYNYKPSIAPYTPTEGEKDGVTEAQAKTLYLNLISENFDIFKEDLYYYRVKNSDASNGVTRKLGVKVTKVNVENSKINFEINFISKGNVAELYKYEQDVHVKISVKNAPINLTHLISWTIHIGKDISKFEEFKDMEIVGSVSGFENLSTESSEKRITYTGKNFTINKNFVDPTDKQEALETTMIMGEVFQSFSSYHLQKLAFKEA